MKWFEKDYSDNRIIADATKTINRLKNDGEVYFNKYNRVNGTSTNSENEKIARYNTGTVTSTNIKYIALFSMTDFNFSDAIKHGKVRQNGNTDEILGIDKENRLTTAGKTDTINITYDGKYQPNIAQNFSLYNVGDGHYKQQFGINGKDGYSSITQFIDKSVMYAAYALKKENYSPQYIVAAPSSSQFNDFYCQNLSKKLGVEYVKDFFQRNLINVKFDKDRDVNDMKKQGFSDKDILEFSNQVKNIAYNEIAHLISTPVREFCNSISNVIEEIRVTIKNINDLNNLNKKVKKKKNLYKEHIVNCIIKHAYNIIINNISQQQSSVTLMNLFFNSNFSFYKPYYNNKDMMMYISYYFKQYNVYGAFNQSLVDMQDLALQYTKQLQTNGYKLRFDTKRFKITQFKKQFRPFLHNVYIVANSNFNKYGKLFKRYQNAKFLIFDEDINSGATLKCTIDALQEKLPQNNSQNIMCLVNAYSASGF